MLRHVLTLPRTSVRPAPTNLLPCSTLVSSNRLSTTASAKKGGGGGKGGPKKSALSDLLKKKDEPQGGTASSGSAGPALATPAQYGDPELRMLLFCVVQSYFKATRTFLLENVDFEQLPAALYQAPFALLVTDKEAGGLETVIYANEAALKLWESNWAGFVDAPSRLQPLQPVQPVQGGAKGKSGVQLNCEGWQASSSGQKFKVRGAKVFNVTDMDNEKAGQAVVFSEYELEGGVVARVTRAPEEVLQALQPKLPPSPEQIKAAEEAVVEQANAVRALKEAEGLGNQDPKVQAAVAELKARKETLSALQKELEAALAAAPPSS